jgi:hypothetical protein
VNDKIDRIPEPPVAPTFAALAKLEPELRALAAAARHQRRIARGLPSYCANQVWIFQFKPRLCGLVGWSSQHPEPLLHTRAAYDVAYDHIYQLLPDCRNCLCFPWPECGPAEHRKGA